MSVLTIGANDVSDQTRALKDAASSKETENAGLRNTLMKRDTELGELKGALNEALRKLSNEADRALKLESELSKVSQDLTYHKVASQNAEQTLLAANAKLRESELRERELQSHLEVLSNRHDTAKDDTGKLEKEKKALEARVRELDAEVRKLSAPVSTIPRKAGRARSSSVSMGNGKNSAMEQELGDTRALLTAKESDLRSAHDKLARTQTELVQSQNEHLAAEKKYKRHITELEASLDEKDDELEMLRMQQGDGGREREEELLKRVEEDEAKILALERLIGDGQKMAAVKATLERTERLLKAESKKVEAAEKRCIEAIQEREETLDELESANIALQNKDAEIKDLAMKDEALQAQLVSLQAELVAARQASSQSDESTPMLVDDAPTTQTDASAAEYLATLLGAIDRLRAERDGLRRDLNFLEAEHKFAVQALNAKPLSVQAALVQPRIIQDERLNIAVTASAIVVQHLHSQLESIFDQRDALEFRLADSMAACSSKDAASKELQNKIEALEVDALRRSELEFKLQEKAEIFAQEAQQSRIDHREAQDALAQANTQLLDLAKSLELAESQRDSLNVQVANLQADLEEAQVELTAAETRYSTLQAHQLSDMSSTDVSRSLRQQIQELESRVMRRTEQIGIHQHDIKRLETNLRLQEERVAEMTSELETLGAEKNAMVEDCADAREARDGAIEKCDCLEMEVEMLERKLEASDEARLLEASTLTAIIVGITVQLRTSASHTRHLVDQKNQLETLLVAARVHLASQTTLMGSADEQLAMHRDRIQSLEEDVGTHLATSENLEQQLENLRRQLHTSILAAGDSAQVQHALALAQSELDTKSKALLGSEAARDQLSTELQSLRDHAIKQAAAVEELERQTEGLHREANVKSSELRENAAQTQQITVALALLQVAIKKRSALQDASIAREETLQQELSALREDLTRRVANGLRLEQSLQDLRLELDAVQAAHSSASADASQATIALAAAHRDLAATSASLALASRAEAEALDRAHAAEEELMAKAADAKRLEQQLVDLRERSNTNAVAESESIDHLRAQHIEEMDALQKVLDSVSSELEQANELHREAEKSYHNAIEQANHSKSDLEARLAAALEHSQINSELEGQLAREQADHATEIAGLQSELQRIGQDMKAAADSSTSAEKLYQESLNELTKAKEDYERRLSDTAAQLSDANHQLEENLVAAQAKHTEEIQRVEAELKQTVAEIGSIQQRLQREVDDREQERSTHTSQLQDKTEQCRRAESLETELHQEIAATRTQLDEARVALEQLEAERITLQTQSTSLTADVHRLKALNSHLENELKSCEARNTKLQEDLVTTRADLSRSEKSGKEIEYQLSIECANQEKMVASLRRELAAFKAVHSLEGVVAELEEKVREMDELLKSKSDEIEANDDRVFEMLKEKKKLTAKVDLLTRKVTSLQAKLVAASEAASSAPKVIEKTISPPPMASARASSTRRVSSSQSMRLAEEVPPVPPVPTMPTQPPVGRSRSSRTASGPAIVPRPKTPERRTSQPVVFKARTPDKRATPKATSPPAVLPESIPSSSSIGKKRARPDEFDDVPVPVQALYGDEERENATPRLRRALHSMQAHTGFTPVRTRALQGAHSPSRKVATSSAGIADMTNSPTRAGDSAKAGKRSWLGKIRGGSSTNRTPTTRPGVFEKAPIS
ncbi:hypothetical protein HWV62_10300 [Athelia sp. TMB]|nr:hypothetical protein HWV62_10300 [Athelia sp. TMB]